MTSNDTGETPDFGPRRKVLSLTPPQHDTSSFAVTQPLPASTTTTADAVNFTDLDHLSRIGGGTGGTVVYKVLHRPTNKLYALKLLHGCHHEEEIIISQIASETCCFCEADHPNVLKCYDLFHAKNEIQFILEYMDGGSLEKAHVPHEPALSDQARQILSGLSYLHKCKIRHHDIKPSNLLMDSRRIVKIADFGGESRRDLLSVGMIVYMSPERINSDINRGRYDGCSGDVWSFGMCILEFYLGKSPFDHPGIESDWTESASILAMLKVLC